MASTSQNNPATDDAGTLRDLVGDDATANFEDDPTFVESNPTGSASSENLGAAADVDDDDDEDEVDEDDLDDVDEGDELEDDDLDEDEDDEDEDDDLDDEDEEDDADEVAAAPVMLAGDESVDEDEDFGDDGRENAVDEDKPDAEAEDDLEGEESSLDTDEVETLRKGLVALPDHLSQREMLACR